MEKTLQNDFIPGNLSSELRKKYLVWQFRRIMGYSPDLAQPSTYQEKLLYRKIYGNYSFYAELADKLKAREYVRQKAGSQYLVPLLGVYDRLRLSDLEGLCEPFIIKTNHGSKWNRIVRNPGDHQPYQLVRYFNSRVKRKYGRRYGEGFYDLIPPRIMIEKLLMDEGELPWNYCFFCYNSHRGFEHYVSLHSPDKKFKGRFDSQWEPWGDNFTPEMRHKYAAPTNSEEMSHLARSLSEGIDFVRVDLYNLKGKIYFGELTFIPGGKPSVVDNVLKQIFMDEMWVLDKHNPRLYRKYP